MADEKKAKSEKRDPSKQSGKAEPKGGGAKGQRRGGGRFGRRVHKCSCRTTTERDAARMLEKYREHVIAALTKQFRYKPDASAALEKNVVNMGLGAAVANPKIIDTAVEELRTIGGQKPVVTRARKAIANFKCAPASRSGPWSRCGAAECGSSDRLVSVALPRMRDFKGVSRKAFDGKGNYTLGLKEQIIFPEVDYDKIDAIKGLNISFVTTAKTDEEGRALLQQLGMPFRTA